MLAYYEVIKRLEKINEDIYEQSLKTHEIAALISQLLVDMRDAPEEYTEIYAGC